MSNIVLIAVLIILGAVVLKNFLFSSISTIDIDADDDNTKSEVTVVQVYTPKTLYKYNGFDMEQIYIAVRGTVYDVSKSRQFYGPSGPYNVFAGHDASRGLAKNSFEPEMVKSFEEKIDTLSDLDASEIKSLDGWEEMFKSKYPVVGTLVNGDDE
ncbi:hypothetical protein CANARDRAFT_7428 [[Candida] arabinofermentans NRRL YB-2248]|uniref:Cytochrome b5 heme-binding domain-containing protein n=1 Tax=[Candida] arabinofermentans NRRL YB-2248 TaxID=983967 RepID=A0A1E4T2U0_9ASCO|nr:hypothetical protein CANARDRAFT_7428 [[Candida] arabinofermentans NRRL YB-2248]